MVKDKKEKTSLARLFVIAFLPVMVYIAYCIGLLGGQEISLDSLGWMFRYELLHPFPIRVTTTTGYAMLVVFVVWAILFMKSFTDQHDLRLGQEYGTAKFDAPENINKSLMNKEADDNKILSQNLRMSLDTHLTGLNNNVVVIGGSGSGKSFYYVLPNGMKANTSMIYTDPNR